MINKAIYAFSGDPITYGHIDIIERAARIFPKLVVGVGMNPGKKYMFTQPERVKMAEESLRHLKNIEIAAFKGLLVDFAYENNIGTIVRGLRNSEDFNYELILFNVGTSQKYNVDTIYFPARQEKIHIASGAVKALQIEQGLIYEYVPLYVKRMMEERMTRQYIVGVTGEIGVGKSYVCEMFQALGQESGVEVHRIDMDDLARELLEKLTEPIYVDTRRALIKRFGRETGAKDGFINKKALGKILFANRDDLHAANEIVYKPLLLRLRRELYGKKGLILLDSALICESEMTYLVNNNVLVVETEPKVQRTRLKARDYTRTQIKNRLASQYTAAKKIRIVRQKIKEAGQGALWRLKNSETGNEKATGRMFHKILDHLQVPKKEAWKEELDD